MLAYLSKRRSGRYLITAFPPVMVTVRVTNPITNFHYNLYTDLFPVAGDLLAYNFDSICDLFVKAEIGRELQPCQIIRIELKMSELPGRGEESGKEQR